MFQETKVECYRNAYQKCKEMDCVTNLGYPEEKKNLEFSCNIGDIEVEYNLRLRTDLFTLKGAKRYPNEPDSHLTEIGQRLTEGRGFQFTAYSETIVFQVALPLVGIADEDAKRTIIEQTDKFIDFLHEIVIREESETEEAIEDVVMEEIPVVEEVSILQDSEEVVVEHTDSSMEQDAVLDSMEMSKQQEDTSDIETEDRRNQLEWIVEKKSENIKRAAELDKRSEELDEKEADLKKKIADFDDHSKEIMEKLESLGKREQDLQQKQDSLSNRENAILIQNENLDKKNAAITSRAKDLKILEEKITEKETQIEERSKAIKEQEEALAGREKNLNTQESYLKEQEDAFFERNDSLTKKYNRMEKEKNDAQQRLAVAEEQNRNIHVKIAQLEENNKFTHGQLEHYLEENKSLKERCIVLQKEGKEHISKFNEAVREIERLKLTVEQVQKNSAMKSEQAKTEKTHLEKFYKDEMEKIHAQYKQEIDKLKEDNEQELLSQQERFRSEKACLQQSFEQQIDTDIQQFDTERTNLLQRFEKEKQEIENQHCAEKESLAQKFEQEKIKQQETHQDELAALQRTLRMEKEQHEDAMDQLRKRMLTKTEEQVAAETKVWEERLSASAGREREYEQRISGLNVQIDNTNQKLSLCKEQLTYAESRAKNAETELQQNRNIILEMQKEIDKYKRNGADFGTPDEVLTDFAETRKENRMLKREIEDIRMENEAIENSLLEQIKRLHEERQIAEEKRIAEEKAQKPENIAQRYVQELQTSGIVLTAEYDETGVFVKGKKESCTILIDVNHKVFLLKKSVLRGNKYMEQFKEWNAEDLTEAYSFDKREIVCKKVFSDITLDVNKILRRFLPLK